MSKSNVSEIASDGLVARDSGEWGIHKLAFLEHFGPSALEATGAKLTRAYLDLFAGPGINIVRGGNGKEFIGSPLKSLELKSRSGSTFTDHFFVNLEGAHYGALTQRVDNMFTNKKCHVARDRIRVLNGNSHDLLPSILDQLHVKSYLFVFADPDNPRQLPWSTLECLRKHRSHESVDLYLLFPYDMALARLVSYQQSRQTEHATVLNSFYGDTSWMDCLQYRSADTQKDRFKVCMTETYRRRLESLWKHSEIVCSVKGPNGNLYTMLFATDHPAGRNIAQWASAYMERQRTSQLILL